MKGVLVDNIQDDLNNKRKVYKDLVFKIKNILGMIEKLGFDIFEDRNQLQEIIKNVESFKKESSVMIVVNKSEIMMEYEKAILELIQFEEKLNLKYKSYNEIVKTCQIIGTKINKDNGLDEIKTYSLMIKDILLKIKNMDLIYYIQNEDNITSDIFSVIYNLIKLEFLIIGKSDIYKFIIDNDINLYFFNRCIKRELESIDLKSEECMEIANKVYTIETSSLDGNYYDLELIKLILVYENSDYKDKIIERISWLIDEISVQEEWIENELITISTLINVKKMDKKKLSPYIKNAMARILSLILGTSLFIGGGFSIFNFFRKAFISPVYNKESKIYSELTDSWSTASEEVYTYSNEVTDEERLVLVYSPWYDSKEDDEKVRTVRTYDLSDVTLDSVYEYLEYNLYKAKLVCQEEIKYDETDSDKYNFEYKEFIENKYTDLEKVEQTNGYFGFVILFEYFYLVVSLTIYLVVTGLHTNSLSLDEVFDDLGNDFRMIRNTTSPSKRIDIEVKKKLKKILDMIYANHELKMEFERLFEENKFLLNDPDELMKKINQVDIEKVEGKVRTLSKKYKVK